MRSYVVRIQEPRAEDGDPERLRGVVDETATGRRSTFTTGDELLRVLTASTDPAADPTAASDK